MLAMERMHKALKIVAGAGQEVSMIGNGHRKRRIRQAV